MKSTLQEPRREGAEVMNFVWGAVRPPATEDTVEAVVVKTVLIFYVEEPDFIAEMQDSPLFYEPDEMNDDATSDCDQLDENM